MEEKEIGLPNCSCGWMSVFTTNEGFVVWSEISLGEKYKVQNC